MVDSILDDVENDEGVDYTDETEAAEADDSDRLPFETLTTFFLAGDRLQREPSRRRRARAVAQRHRCRRSRPSSIRCRKRLWLRMCELADELAAALVDGDEPDVVETQAVAAELHDLLRPYV